MIKHPSRPYDLAALIQEHPQIVGCCRMDREDLITWDIYSQR